MDSTWNKYIDNMPLRSILNATAFAAWFWLSVALLSIH